MKCNHKWIVVSNTNTRTKAEIRDKLKTTTQWSLEPRPEELKATNIIILQCSKCGKLDKTIAEI